MIKKLKQFAVLSLSIALIAVTVVGLSNSVALADNTNVDAACEALNNLGKNGCAGADDGIASLLKTIVRILQSIVGFIAIVMIVIAGMKYTLSQGDNNAIGSAKNTIIYSIVGLVIVGFAEVIVQFVLNRLIE